MKKMKKLITLLISLTMIFALCACGQTGGAEDRGACQDGCSRGRRRCGG